MTDLGAAILSIFTALRAALGAAQTQDRAYNARVALVWHRLHRTAKNLACLFNNWKAGILPRRRPSRAGMPHRPYQPRPEGTAIYPTRHGWLADAGWQVRISGAHLENMVLNTPEFQTFLREVPQAGRLLRPVLHLMRMDIPAVIALPPRPRRVRPKKPKPAPEPIKINPDAHVPWGLGYRITRRLKKAGFTIAPRIPKIKTAY